MDAQFLSGEFFEADLPRDKAYLKRYFSTDIQRAFLKYVTIFGDWKNFIEHTGFYCSKRNLQVLHARLKKLEKAHKAAKSSMDFNALESIESGRFRVRT